MYDPVYNGLPHIQETHQLPEIGPPSASQAMRRDAVVATEIRDDLVDERVALDLTKDRRAMSTELLGDNPEAQPDHSPAGNFSRFIEVNKGVGAPNIDSDQSVARRDCRISNLPNCRTTKWLLHIHAA